MKSKIMSGAMLAVAVTALSIAPAFAQTSASSTPHGKGISQAQRLAALGTRGEKEISIRVDSLNKLIARIQGLRNVSDAQKNSIISTLQGLIANLGNLETQINAESSSTALKSDVQAITQNYRVYALAIPQLNLFAAADRITTIVAMMSEIGSKLQTRLSAATGISSMSALQADLADFGSKIGDANSQAQAAVSEVSPLTPDQGDKTKMASNTATLKDARTKIQAAQKDLVAARKDAQTIIQALVKSDKSIMGEENSGASNGTPGSATTGTTTTGTTTTQ